MHARFSAILVFPFLFACAAAQLAQEKASDFSTNGFLDDNTFQVTAVAKPDPAAKGLVAQRESAAVKARGGLQESAVKALVECRVAIFAAEHKAGPDLASLSAEAKAYLTGEFRKYLPYGAIVEEYYEKDNSASIVYRIIKSGLKSEIEGYSIRFTDKKEGEKK